MKSLLQYIVENIQPIFEGSGGYNTYFEKVEDCIDFYYKNEDIFHKYNIDENIIKQLYTFANGEIPLTIDISNRTLKLRRIFQTGQYYDNINSFGEFNQRKSTFKFNGANKLMDVGDGGLSKMSKAGRNTEPQELLLCELINSKKPINEINFNELLEKYQLDESFEISAKLQYNKLQEYIGDNLNNYFAYRPTNFKNDEINNLFDKIISNKQIFNGSNKQFITPADIFIYRKDYQTDIIITLKNILTKFNEANSKEQYDIAFKDCKNIFAELLTSKQFVPISIKKITDKNPNNEVEILNITSYDIEINKNNYNLYITKSGFVGEFYTLKGNEHLKFNFRSNQKTIDTLTFEFNKPGDGGAVGKFKTFVNNYIELNPDLITLPTIEDFYTDYRDNKNFNINDFYNEKIQIANKIPNFTDPKYDKEKLAEIQSDEKSFYILVSCLLFLEFLEKLYFSTDNEEVNEFFTFIKDCYLASKKLTNYSLPYILIK